MNVVDYVIIGIFAVSVIFGLYRGFVGTVLNTGGCLLSFGLSFALYPRVAEWIRGNEGLMQTLSHYTDATNRIGDLELSLTNVTQLTTDSIGDILAKVSLPHPLDTLLQVNLEQQVFGAGNGVKTAADYVSQTIMNAGVNIISFLAAFIGLYLVISLAQGLIRAIFRFPVLKQLDAVAGGLFGLLRGAVLCYAAFALLPLVMTMIPVDNLTELINASLLAPVFNNGNLLLAVMNGHM